MSENSCSVNPKMSKLVGLSGLKKSDLGYSASATAKGFQISSRQPSYSNSSGSFANLNIIAEKLVREQASAKTDLHLAEQKVKKLSEQIRVLEEKLQAAYNENAKLKVKHKEDEKLWKGLESKFFSTKTLCDQLTETLQLLSDQVQDAEKDKAFFANKMSQTSLALDSLYGQMKSLSLKLDSSEETIRNREKQLEELAVSKEKLEKQLTDEHCKVLSLTDEKDNLIKNFEDTVASNQSTRESLTSKMNELRLELTSKEDNLNNMNALNERKEKENADLMATNKNLSNHLDKTMKEIDTLQNFVKVLTHNLADLDRQSAAFWENVVKVNTFFDSCFNLLQVEKKLAAEKAQQRFDWLHGQLLQTTSEKEALQLANHELNKQISELQNEQKSRIAQHAEEQLNHGTEKQECINLEKEKGEKAVLEMEKKFEEELAECKEESKQQLLKIEREHTALVKKIRMEYDKKEENLKSNHSKELNKMQLLADYELKEMQWKVEIPQEDQEAISRQACNYDTSDGTITKRLKTESTIMIENPRKNRRQTSKRQRF